MEIKSRIFLSCGQNDGEMQIAEKIKEALQDQYEVYIAREQHNFDGFKEHIFPMIENSEYFLFIDFKRENGPSLFSHQELSVAAYLRLDVLAFQEEGAEKHPGLMKYVMANPILFFDRGELPTIITEEVRKNGWKTGWRKHLEIGVADSFSSVKNYGGIHKPGLWFHLVVSNLHNRKQALNCTAFVVGVSEPDGHEKKPELSELKWKGVTTSHLVTIPPSSGRKLDAFHIFSDSRDRIVLGVNPYLVDSTAMEEQYTFQGSGRYKITYRVYSDNFPVTEKDCFLNLDTKSDFKVEFGVEGEDPACKIDTWPIEFTSESTTELISFPVTEVPTSTGAGPKGNVVGMRIDGQDVKKNGAFTPGSQMMSSPVKYESGTINAIAVPNCPRCGSPLANNTLFCEKCGNMW